MTVYTTKNGAIFIQPNGANNVKYYLGCHGLDELSETTGKVESIRAFNVARNGWDTVGSKISPPDDISITIDTLYQRDVDWLEKQGDCSMGIYVYHYGCGRADAADRNYERAIIVPDARRTSIKYSGLAAREEDRETTLEAGFTASPPLLHAVAPSLMTTQLTSSGSSSALVGLWANTDTRCVGACGAARSAGDVRVAVGKSPTAPGVAIPIVYDATTRTWSAMASGPFASKINIASVVVLDLDNTTQRVVVAAEASSGTQGYVSYTDDWGTTWHNVAIGSAAAGHGAVGPQALVATGTYTLLLASAEGYIYRSTDAGETWVAVETATITATDYRAIHLVGDYGIAVGDDDSIAITRTGGVTWEASAADTGTGDDLLTCWVHDANNLWVGTSGGELWYSYDGGSSWYQRTGWSGSGSGSVAAMYWQHRYVGYIVHNDTVGTLLRTIDGGATWETVYTAIVTLAHLVATGINSVIAVGEVDGTTAEAVTVEVIGG